MQENMILIGQYWLPEVMTQGADLSCRPTTRLPSVAMSRKSASASRSLELLIAKPAGGKNQKAKVKEEMTVAISPFIKPSTLEIHKTASKRKSMEASFPTFIR